MLVPRHSANDPIANASLEIALRSTVLSTRGGGEELF